MADLSKARQASKQQAAMRKAAGLKTTRTPLERLAEDPTSKAKAIVAKCYDCVGGDSDRCWQWRVGNCDIHNCGLHWVRPHRRLEGRPMPRSLIDAGWGEPEPDQPPVPRRATGPRHTALAAAMSGDRETDRDGAMQTLPGL